MGTIKDLISYQKAFKAAMEIFEISKNFPKEETYSLTDQIRRSSRAVNANLAEAYKKRRYPNHFISKLTDADMENSETQTWLDFAKECKYITQETYDNLFEQTEEVAKLLNYMINNHEKFLIKNEKSAPNYKKMPLVWR